MKRLGFLNIILLLLLVFASEIQAGIRSAEEAMAIAGRFMAESKKEKSILLALMLMRFRAQTMRPSLESFLSDD